MPPDAPSPLPDPGPLLESHGFRVRLRRRDWWDCMIHDGRRAFVGHGESPDEALADALRTLVPSRRARRLFLDWLEADALPSAASPDATPAPPAAPSGEATVPDTLPALPAAAPESPAVPPRPAPAPLPPPVSEEEARACLGELHDLRDVVHGSYEELAELAPDRIRLWTLVWMAEVRSAEDRFPSRKEVAETAHQIARELQRISGDFWPGVVVALKRTCTPRNALSHAGFEPVGEGPGHWADVARLAHERLRALAEAPGVDEDGWADEEALDPPPRRAEDLLAEVRARVAKLTGPLNEARIDRTHLPDGSWPEPIRKELRTLACKARWLRGRAEVPGRWGVLMGRLRFVGERDPDLKGILDPGFRPPRGWAKALGQDPDAKRKRRRRKEVLADSYRSGEDWDRDRTRGWLLRAFDVLDTPEIASLVAPLAEIVGSLGRRDMPDRRCRSRLTKLKNHLAAPSDADRGARIRAEAEKDALDGGDAPDEEGRDEGPDPLRDAVLPHTRGQRLLFISNREDPHLKETLEQVLEPASLEWCAGKVRKVESAAARVRANRYDLVLSATGFMPHKTDTKLRDACRYAEVPYVRVYRGRLGACMRALRRDLGLATAP